MPREKRNGRRPGRDCTKEKELIANDPDLGKIPDGQMALRYGVSRSVSSKVRRMLDLPPAPSKFKRNRPAYDKVREFKHWLGVYYDCHIAKELRVGERVVTEVRHELGIGRGNQPLEDWRTPLLRDWKCVKSRIGKTRNQWSTWVTQNL